MNIIEMINMSWWIDWKHVKIPLFFYLFSRDAESPLYSIAFTKKKNNHE